MLSSTSCQKGRFVPWRGIVIFRSRISGPLRPSMSLCGRLLRRAPSRDGACYNAWTAYSSTNEPVNSGAEQPRFHSSRSVKPPGRAGSGVHRSTSRQPRPWDTSGADPAGQSNDRPQYRSRVAGGAGGLSWRSAGGLQFADMLRDLHYLKAEGAVDVDKWTLKHLCAAAPALVTRTLRRLADQSPPLAGPSAVLDALISIREFGLPLSQDNARVLLDVCMQHGDAKTAHEFMTQFSGDGITPANVRTALRIFSAAGAKAAAQDAIEILRDFGETILEYDYDMLLAAFASAGDTEAIIATGRVMSSRGFVTKPGFYNAVIKSCVKNRDHIRALHFFDEMRKLKIPANRYTWGSIIQSAVSHGDMVEAETLLTELITTAPRHLCAHAFNHVMQGYALRGEADAALRWFRIMRGGSTASASKTDGASKPQSPSVRIAPDAHSYSIMLRVASERNDKTSIFDFVRAMLSENIPLNHSTWRMATAPFGRQLDCAGLRTLIEAIHATGARTNIEMWRDLIGCYGKRGMAREAYQVLRDMEEKHGVVPDHSCWLRVVRAFASGRNQHRTSHQSSSTFSRPQEASASAGGGDWRGALETLRAMRARGVRPSADAWKYVFSACTFASNASASLSGGAGKSTAQHLLELLLEMYETDGLLPRSDTWGDIIAALAAQGTAPAAVDGRMNDDHYPGGSVGSISSGGEIFTHGDTTAAEEVLLFNFLSRCPPQTQQKFLVDAVSTLCRSNSTEKARQLLLRLHPYRREHLPGWEVLLEHASMHQGRGAAQAIVAAFASVSGQSAPISMHLMLLEACARTRDFDRLFQIADKLLGEHRNRGTTGGRNNDAVAATLSSIHGDVKHRGKAKHVSPIANLLPPKNALDIPKHVGFIGKPIASSSRTEVVGLIADEGTAPTSVCDSDEVTAESRPNADLFNCLLQACLDAGNESRFDDYLTEMEGFEVAQNARTLSLIAVKHISFGRTDMLDACVQSLVRSIMKNNSGDHFDDYCGDQHNAGSNIGKSDVSYGTSNSTPENITYSPTSKISAAAESILSSLGFSRVAPSNRTDLLHSDVPLEIARSERTKVSRLLNAPELASDAASKAGVSISVLVNEYLGPLLNALVSRGLWGLADKLLARLQTDTGNNCDQLCYKYTMALAEAGRIEDAANFAEKCVVNKGIRILCEVSTWHRILQRAKELCKPEEAQYVIDRLFISVGPHLQAHPLEEEGAQTRPALPDALCWALLVGTYADAGRVNEAVDAMQSMGAQSGLRPVLACYDALFERLHTDGDAKGCLSLLNRMIDSCSDHRSTGGGSDTSKLYGIHGRACDGSKIRAGGSQLWREGIAGPHRIIERIIGFAPDALPIVAIDSSSGYGSCIPTGSVDTGSNGREQGSCSSSNSSSHSEGESNCSNGIREIGPADKPAHPGPISAVLWPTSSHWFYTIDCVATKRGGAEALRVLERMRQPHSVGGGGMRPSQACYSSTISALIQDDSPELIGQALVMSRADGVVLSGSVLDGVRSMRRYDVVLEAVEGAQAR